jgi:hypothetical protein
VNVARSRTLGFDRPKIVAATPQIKLPDLPITVLRRSDASGTTFVFTKHLSAIRSEFAKQVGSGTTVDWPSSDNRAPLDSGILRFPVTYRSQMPEIEIGPETVAYSLREGEMPCAPPRSGRNSTHSGTSCGRSAGFSGG